MSFDVFGGIDRLVVLDMLDDSDIVEYCCIPLDLDNLLDLDNP